MLLYSVRRGASGRVVTCSWGDEDERDGEDDGHGALRIKDIRRLRHGRDAWEGRRHVQTSGTRSGPQIRARGQAPSTESDSRPRGPCPPSRLIRGRSMHGDDRSGASDADVRSAVLAVFRLQMARKGGWRRRLGGCRIRQVWSDQDSKARTQR